MTRTRCWPKPICVAVSSRQTVLIHQVADQIGDARRPTGPFLFLVRSNQARLRLVCQRSPCDAHHLKFAEPRALGRKVSDEFTVPLCREHHHELHRNGNERAW